MKLKVLLLLLVIVSSAAAQTEPVHAWKLTRDNISGNVIKDIAGSYDAIITERPNFRESAGESYLYLDGLTNEILISDDIQSLDLPEKNITLEAVMYVQRKMEYGAAISLMHDTGGSETGVILGYSKKNFYFALASEGADDGEGMLTYMRSDAKIEFGKWYHVAGVYDGKTMQLYVNGIEDAHSDEQHGKILYPENTFFELGAYKDENEFFQMEGGLYYTAIYDEALSSDDVKSKSGNYKTLLDAPKIERKDPAYLVAPYQQFATQNEITILWETEKVMKGYVEYTDKLPLTGKSEVVEGTDFFEVKLTGLKPGTNYFYRVVNIDDNDNVIYSQLCTFKTAPDENTPIAFCVVGDTQSNPEVWKRVSDQIYGERPDFVLHAGDVVGSGRTKTDWTEEFFRPSQTLMSRIPIYTVLGNHEEDHDFYYKYMANPSPEYYYSFKYGNSLFFMIDSNHPVEEGSEQYKMLEEDLKTKKGDWKFAVFHHPPYSSDEDDYGNTYRESSTRGDRDMQPLVKLFEKYDVDMVFNGHIHDYERTRPIAGDKTNREEGVVYVQTGGGGGGLENYAPTRSPFTAKVHRDHHYCYLIIDGNYLEFKAIDQNGVLFDQITITK